MFEIMNICSKSNLLIIKFLGRRYRKGFYVRELANELDIGLGTASKSLRLLADAGLVVKEKKGRLVIYSANMENVLFREFKILLTLMEIDSLIWSVKAVSSEIIMFGSCATGEDTVESDIDIFIEADNKQEILGLVENYQKKTEREISPIVMNSHEFMVLRTKNKTLFERINTGKILHKI